MRQVCYVEISHPLNYLPLCINSRGIPLEWLECLVSHFLTDTVQRQVYNYTCLLLEPGCQYAPKYDTTHALWEPYFLPQVVET